MTPLMTVPQPTPNNASEGKKVAVRRPHDQAARIIELGHALRSAGWEIAFIDLDTHGGAVRAQVRIDRHDGRWLWARLDHLGRCTLEAHQRHITLGCPASKRGGRWPLSPQIEDVFLWRRRPTNAAELVNELVIYLVDNARTPAPTERLRKACQALLTVPKTCAGAVWGSHNDPAQCDDARPQRPSP